MAPARKDEQRAKIEDPRELLALAQRALGILGVELADRVGVHPKTVMRWHAGRSSVSAAALGKLAVDVFPKDPALARRIHAYAAEELAFPGLVPPPPLPDDPSTAVAAVPASFRAESVVFAACDAMDASPRAIRPALLAALRRAREVGITMDDLERELAPAAKPAPRVR